MNKALYLLNRSLDLVTEVLELFDWIVCLHDQSLHTDCV